MKWFKHDSDASIDAKLKKLRLKYGMEGYGVYWFCLEMIARGVERHNLTFELEHDAEIIADDTGIHPERIGEMMAYMCNLRLFELSHNGVITCLKMATRTDEYTAKLIKTKAVVPIVSGQYPDSVGTKSVLIEEKRREKKRQKSQPSTEDYEISSLMWTKIQELDKKQRQPDLEKWANTIRLLRERDNRTIAEIRRVFLWAHNDDFWRTNILSPDKLRKQFTRISVQINGKGRDNEKTDYRKAMEKNMLGGI